MATALSGIRVAAFTHFAAGPIAAQYLGSFGADVIKVESPQQDVNRYALRDPNDGLQGISPYYVVTNRNQRGIVIDLKKASGMSIARQLIACESAATNSGVSPNGPAWSCAATSAST